MPKAYRFENQREVRIARDGDRIILEPIRKKWSRRFLELAGKTADFPYPSEPGAPDPGPDLD